MQKRFVILILLILPPVLVLSLFYFYFWKPATENPELFPLKAPSEITGGIYRILPNGKVDVSSEIKAAYGISAGEISAAKRKIFFIDGREPEEFESSHLENSKNLRSPDIAGTGDIEKLFSLSGNDFQNSLIVIYCHDGTRSAEIVSRLDQPNIKFLIEGAKILENKNFAVFWSGKEPVKESIRDRGISISAEEASLLTQKNAFVIDGRLYRKAIFPNAFVFRIGDLPSVEYAQKLQEILKNRDKQIIYLADIYPDLFYAKLLAQRLEENHEWDMENFHVVFNQSELFYERTQNAFLADQQ